MRQFYPEACAKLVGDQRAVADDAAAPASANAATAAAPVADDEEQELELDVKEEADGVADAPAPVATGKVRLEVFWRAFWCVRRLTRVSSCADPQS